jgi:hypothetical protein
MIQISLELTLVMGADDVTDDRLMSSANCRDTHLMGNATSFFHFISLFG